MATVKKTKKKEKKSVYEGNVYIQASFNNTIVTVTDLNGNALSWASSGGLGFKGAKKSTPFAAQTVAESAVQKAVSYGLREVHVFVKGPGMGRENAVRAIGKNTRSFVKKMSRLGHKPACNGIWQGEQANSKRNSQKTFRICLAVDGKAKTSLYLWSA